MKSILHLFLIASLSMACTSDHGRPTPDNELIGKWKLIEQLVDPGDGSGTFQPIESDRVIQFFSDGTVEVNGVLCFMSSEVGDAETGTYEITGDNTADTTYEGEIIPNTCNSRSAKVFFNLPLDGNLILWYLCIEPCGQKFEKVD
ncbi:lipocalin family protein [Hyunsoonleella rubra]|uniref:Lipocalin family protein n=1 Tax=Hyunsoonleella rubra TaxID=1737062 RepID=A0ABW5TGP7_9FLAO